MKLFCIVPAAGRGRRLGSAEDKVFVRLKGKPMLLHTLEALAGSTSIDKIIVVVSGRRLNECKSLIKHCRLKKVCEVVRGGNERFNSVKNGLLKAGKADFILVHDGARPFITKDLLNKVVTAARTFGAAICATRVKQTIKVAGDDLFIRGTPGRKTLWEAQTPQVFKKELIMAAYRKSRDNKATDDSSLVEKLGYRVKIVEGSTDNIKITTAEDLKLAHILLSQR